MYKRDQVYNEKKKIYPVACKCKKAGVAILISNKTDIKEYYLKKKKFQNNKNLIHHEDITTNVYT